MNNSAHKFDNMGEMSQFFERHNVSKFKQKEIDNLTGPIFIKEI